MGIVIRQAVKATSVNYVGVLLGIFTTFCIMTKYLDPDVIGLTRVLYEVAYIISLLAMLGAPSSGMRFFPYFKDEKTGNHGFFYYYLLLPIVGCLVFGVLYLIFKTPLIEYFGKKDAQFGDFFYYVIPLFVVLAFWQFFEAYANINMRIAIPKLVREVGMRVFILGMYLAFGFRLIDVTGLILSYIIAYGICMLVTGFYSIRIGGAEMRHDWSYVTPELRKKVGWYTGFLMISAISGNLMAQMDVFQLTNLKGLYDVGVYVIALNIAEVTNMPLRNISPIASPLAAQAMKDNDMLKVKDLYRQVSVHQMLAASVILLFVWVNLDNIFALIPHGEIYSQIRWAVLFLGLSKVVFGVFNFGNVIMSFSKYYYLTLIITIVMTFITYGTNLYFIPILGLTGAALATLIASILIYSFQQCLVQLTLKVHPVSWAHLRVVILIALLYGLNFLIPTLLDESQSWYSAIADGAVRSILLAVAALFLMYKLRISEPINRIVDEKLLRK